MKFKKMLRLASMKPEVKTVNDLMQKGYQESRRGHNSAAVDTWIECWEAVKAALPHRPFDVANERSVFPGLKQPIFNWVTDLELELLNATQEQPDRYGPRYLAFCEEALDLLLMPDHRSNFHRARASALWKLGRQAEAEKVIEMLLAEDRTDVWTWIWWGDFYSVEQPHDFGRAREIYQQALQQEGLKEPHAVQERLAMLDSP